MPHAIGIDLGTVYSCVGVYIKGSVEIFANNQGNRVTPSIVAFNDTERLIGDAAKNQMTLNPENTIYGAKRIIGRKFADISKDDMDRSPFEILNKMGRPEYEVTYLNNPKLFSPEQISAEVLREMKKIAENFLNEEVTHAVITVPAHFSDSQRQATKDAAEIIGLNVLQLLNEPTAAAVAYGFNKQLQNDQNILVFDMGGGTFDVSILTIDDDVYEVKAVGGDMHLGGEDFNNRLLDHFLEEIEHGFGVDLKHDKVAKSRLLRECEIAKIALSTSSVANVKVDALYNGTDFHSSITRARFEELNDDFFDKAIEIVEQTIKDAKLTKAEIEEVVLVGGSTYIPKVQKMLQDSFGGKELNKSIKPEEAVAYGAAVHAAILNGDDSDDLNLVLLDVTRFSLGLEVRGGLFHKLIHRNSQIPLKVVESRFSTGSDNQRSVVVKVYEGERKLAKENNLLGKFMLNKLPKALAKQLKIRVSFEVNADGILKVSAVETSSGIANNIVVDVFKDGLDANLENKILEAKKFAAQDEAKIRLQQNKAASKKTKEKFDPIVKFQTAMSNLVAKKYDEAYEIFTKILQVDPKNIDAMERRAEIHFAKQEFEECVIECAEILRIRQSNDIKLLMDDAESKIGTEEDWFAVLHVSKHADKKDVEKAYRTLAKLFSPNAKKNAKKSVVDREKLQRKMARINKAKTHYATL